MSETIKPNNIERGFILVDKPNDLIDSIKKRASFINNLNSKDISLSQITDIVEFNMDKYHLSSFKKYFGVDFPPLSSQHKEFNSKHQRYGQLLNKLNNDDIEKCFLSYGIFAPAYIEELFLYKKENEKNEEHKSLLIGALTIDTVQEYLGIVKSVFSNPKSLSIDVDGNYLVNEAQDFQIMNGLQTSFKDNTFDTIHTNFLLHQLCDKNGKDSDESGVDMYTKFKDLSTEAYRILKSKGKIIMVEGNLNKAFKTDNDFFIRNKIISFFRGVGFENIKIKPTKTFSNAKDLFSFTRSSSGNYEMINDEKNKVSKSVITITASKR